MIAPGSDFAPVLGLPDARRVLLFSPHPDDDVIGCGGALSLHREAGSEVRVVHVFDGALGGDPRVRRAEAEASARQLGGLELEFWGLPEGHSPATAEELAGVRRVRGLCAEFEPDLIYAPWHGEAHGDHRTVARVVRTALALRADAGTGRAPAAWGYEVWTPLAATRVLDVSGVWERKLAGLREHASQLAATDLERASAGLAAHRALLLPERTGFAEAFAPLGADFPNDPREQHLLEAAVRAHTGGLGCAP